MAACEHQLLFVSLRRPVPRFQHISNQQPCGGGILSRLQLCGFVWIMVHTVFRSCPTCIQKLRGKEIKGKHVHTLCTRKEILKRLEPSTLLHVQ
jgi:hypothetical protein